MDASNYKINIKLAIAFTGEARPDTFVLPYWKLLLPKLLRIPNRKEHNRFKVLCQVHGFAKFFIHKHPSDELSLSALYQPQKRSLPEQS